MQSVADSIRTVTVIAQQRYGDGERSAAIDLHDVVELLLAIADELDAAAQVLAGSKEPLNTKAMIEQMAAKGLWTSPGGKTPHATLYSAILREINTKGKDARFTKTERGKFASKA